jgi:hypothetical protein
MHNLEKNLDDIKVVRRYLMKHFYVGPPIIIGMIFSSAALFLGFISEDADRTKLVVAGAAIFVASILIGMVGAAWVFIKIR